MPQRAAPSTRNRDSGAAPADPRAAVAILLRLLDHADRRLLAVVLVLMLFAALTEGVGVLMLVPMLALIDDGRFGETMGMAPGHWLRLLGGSWTLENVLILFLALVALRALIQHGQAVLSAKLQHRLVDSLRRELFAGLIKAEWRWFATRRTSDHVATLIVNISRIGSALNQLLMLVTTAVTASVYLGAVFFLSWQVAIVAVFGGLLALVGFGGHRRRAIELGQHLTKANRALQAEVGDTLAGMRTVRIFGAEDRRIERLDIALGQLRTQQVHYAASASHARVLMQLGGAVLLAALLWLGLRWWSAPLAILIPILFAFGRLVPMLGILQQSWHFWLHSAPAALEASALLAETARHAERPASRHAPDLKFDEAIRLDHIDLVYDGRDKAALCDISLSLPARTTTAIVGPSGSGKSSLADLLMGLISPDRGTMHVDGMLIEESLRQRWRRSVAYVEQDCFLFHDSVRANLLWAAPTATDAQLREALKTASADFVFALPNGLDTLVGTAGVQLSGGERQRIGLARALLGKPAILILDEATSALDPVNEAAVNQAISAMHGRLTLVLIGHRPWASDRADQVIRLEDGRIVEMGLA